MKSGTLINSGILSSTATKTWTTQWLMRLHPRSRRVTEETQSNTASRTGIRSSRAPLFLRSIIRF